MKPPHCFKDSLQSIMNLNMLGNKNIYRYRPSTTNTTASMLHSLSNKLKPLIRKDRMKQRFCCLSTPRININVNAAFTSYAFLGIGTWNTNNQFRACKNRNENRMLSAFPIRFSSNKGTSGSRSGLWRLTPRNIFLHVVAVGGGMTVFSLYSTSKSLHEAVPTDRCIIDVTKNQYLYAADPEDGTAFLKHLLSRWWPFPLTMIARPIAWQLFEEIGSDIVETRENAIKNFARLSSLLETECQHFSICMDVKTAIALARNGADPRLFTSSRLHHPEENNKDYYGIKFRHIFCNLPNDQIHETLATLVKSALKTYHPTETEQEDRSLDYYSGFESDFHLSQRPVKVMGQVDFLKICLQGIVSHSRIYDRIKALLGIGILDLLVAISKEHGNNGEIMSLVLKVLANLSCDSSSAQPIKDTGCLKILVENSLIDNVRLSLPAKRALHNLDRESNNPILPPGVYQLSPDFGSDESALKCDIIFVHGLLGGVFRTWRRQDLDPYFGSKKSQSVSKKVEVDHRMAVWKSRMFDLRSKLPMQYNPTLMSNPDENVVYPSRRAGKDGKLHETYEEVPLEVENVPSEPTQCWPRDWLAKDYPAARIIALDFESFISRWMNVCPIESVERRFHERGAELLKKLKDAGVGKRPVIWVTHSMGGLLVKSLLCQSDASKDQYIHDISRNTKGIVFCSVPHAGTQMIVLNTARRWLFLPTEEIEELSNEGNQLTHLHECFTKLYNKLKFKVLSFAEVLETRTGLGMKFKLVPFKSADIGYGEFYPLPLDHLNTCKPWSRGSFMYRKTLETIIEAVKLDEEIESVPTTISIPEPTHTSWISCFEFKKQKEIVNHIAHSTNSFWSSWNFFSKPEREATVNNCDASPRVSASENITAPRDSVDTGANKTMRGK